MLKSIKDRLPYPHDIKKKPMPNITRNFTSLRILGIYFDVLTGERISIGIPEMPTSFDARIFSLKNDHYYSNIPDQIRMQLHKRVFERTSFKVTAINLKEISKYQKSKSGRSMIKNRSFYDQIIKKELSVEQTVLYNTLPSPILTGIVNNASLVVYISSSQLTKYFQFAEKRPDLILQSFSHGNKLLQSMVKALKLWSGNYYMAGEEKVNNLFGCSISSNDPDVMFKELRSNFFAILYFIDELLAYADNSFCFSKEEID